MSVRDVAGLLALIAIGVSLPYLTWIGYGESDDYFYANGAIGWLESFPYAGQNHWELRHPIVLLLVATFSIFGINEVGLVASQIVVYIGILLLVGLFVRRELGFWVAVCSVILVALVPVILRKATFAHCDLTEAFLILCSLVLFHRAGERAGNAGLLVASGLCAGLAILVRETTAFLILFYGLLFLAGYAFSRWRYWLLVAGFLPVIAMEAAVMWVVTGNPLHRYLVTYQGVSESTPGQVSWASAQEGFDLAGNFHTNSLMDPILAVFAGNEFALTAILFVPAAIWAWRRSGRLGKSAERLLKLSIGFSVLWFVCVGYAPFLWLEARYFIICGILASIVIATWLVDGLWLQGWRFVAVLVAGALLSANAAMLVLENRDPLLGEHALATAARTGGEPVYTDPVTLTTAAFLLREDGLRDRVSDESAPGSALFLYNPNRVLKGRRNHTVDPSLYRPQENWQVVEVFEPRKPLTAALLEHTPLGGMLPKPIADKLSGRTVAPVVLYRLPLSP